MNIQTREAWLEERRSGIGGSDIGCILGLSKWSTPLDIFLDKLGQGKHVDPDNEAIRWGNLLEDVVAQEYSERTGHKIQRINTMMRPAHMPHVIANIDRAVVNNDISGTVRWNGNRLTTDRILEVKTGNMMTTHLWGEAGSDEMPDYFLTQAQWYMGVTGAKYCDVAVLLGGQDFRIYHLERDQSLIDTMFEMAADFWELVEARTPPDPITWADASTRWPQHVAAKKLDVDVTVVKHCQELTALGLQKKALTAQEDDLKLQIGMALGDAEAAAFGGDALCTWKTQTSNRLDAKAFRAEHPELAETYMTESQSRVLRIGKLGKLETML